MNKAEKALEDIKKSLEKGEKQVESGELLEMDVLESISAIVDNYFKSKTP